MEVDEIQMQGRKFQKICNNGTDAKKLGEDNEEDEQLERNAGRDELIAGGGGLLCGWPSSRIVRVSRASGGKDRHSKVWTSKGLRDRRVRLSVTTAIQFYDLQDRLGYDQPSKAVEWLLKAAESSIAELPSLKASFPDTPKQISDKNRPSNEVTEHGFYTEVVEFNAKSACSSTSETSKGSAGLSLSRSESRIKARERARERAVEKEKEKEKEKENESQLGLIHNQNHHYNNTSQNSSFTELLTTGISAAITNDNPTPSGSSQMDYFVTPSTSRTTWGNTLSPFNVTGDQNQFSFVQENLVPIVSSMAGGDYNLNFSISSGLAGFNRGTLQSNAPSFLPHHLQRFPAPIDGSNIPSFFIAPNAVPLENHHHHHLYQTGIDSRLQLCYGDSSGRHSDLKDKGKN